MRCVALAVQPPKKQPLFSFGKKPEPEVKLAKADWLGLGGFTLDNFELLTRAAS